MPRPVPDPRPLTDRTTPEPPGAVRLDVLLLGVVLVMVVAFLAVVGFSVSQSRKGVVYEYTIPKGTAAEQKRGVEVKNLPPAGLLLKVNDSIKITNNDVVAHTYSFLVLRPGETGQYTFRNKGVFVGSCTVGSHPQVTITVT